MTAECPICDGYGWKTRVGGDDIRCECRDPKPPLAIDLFCGLGGWSEGFLAEGYDVIGFDVEQHRYPSRQIDYSEGVKEMSGKNANGSTSLNWSTESKLRQSPLTGGYDEYPGQLVLQDVLTIHGSQFRNAAVIVASPPCQEFSYMAMPWKRAKRIAGALCEEVPFPEAYTGSRTLAQLTALFDACFRIQREASEAAGHHIPLVVENVKGAQPWVGRAKANFGSFYLWGDVAMVGNRIVLPQSAFGAAHARAYRGAVKVGGITFSGYGTPGYQGVAFNGTAARRLSDDSFGWSKESASRGTSSRSSARKAASAQIAKIPRELSSWVARAYKPQT